MCRRSIVVTNPQFPITFKFVFITTPLVTERFNRLGPTVTFEKKTKKTVLTTGGSKHTLSNYSFSSIYLFMRKTHINQHFFQCFTVGPPENFNCSPWQNVLKPGKLKKSNSKSWIIQHSTAHPGFHGNTENYCKSAEWLLLRKCHKLCNKNGTMIQGTLLIAFNWYRLTRLSLV